MHLGRAHSNAPVHAFLGPLFSLSYRHRFQFSTQVQKYHYSAKRSNFSKSKLDHVYPPTVFESLSVITPSLTVPKNIVCPDYAFTGKVKPVSVERRKPISAEHIQKMRAAGILARRCLDLALSKALPGVTTNSIDEAVHLLIIEAEAYPAAINFHGFPKSLCISVNEVACHGIPSTRKLVLGDLVSFDCTCFLNGVFGDCCGSIIVGSQDLISRRTNIKDGDSSVETVTTLLPDTEQYYNELAENFIAKCGTNVEDPVNIQRRRRHFLLNYATYKCLHAGISVVAPGIKLKEIAIKIKSELEDIEKKTGVLFKLVDDFCGHFIGEQMHLKPFIRHSLRDLLEEKEFEYELKTNDIFTIEPILCEGNPRLKIWDDNWSAVTLDNSWSAQWEHTVMVTDSGCEILTVPY